MNPFHKFITTRWKWLAGVAIVVLGGGYLYTRSQDQNQPKFTTTHPQIRTITESLTVSGAIAASESASVSFLATGRLNWVGVQVGDRVKKWQALAKIDTQTLEKQFKTDLNNFEKEFRDHDQTLDDYDFYGSPDIDRELKRILEKAQFDLDNTVLQVEIRDLAIRYSTAISPLDGIVTHIDKPFSGQTAAITDTITIVNPNTLEFEAVVDEEDISLLQFGQAVTIKLDSFPEELIESQVAFIEFTPSTSESGGTGYKVKFSLPVDNQLLQYKIGMNGDADIILTQKSNVLTVPVDSLITRDEQTSVEVSTDDSTKTVTIEIGANDGAFVEVVTGLNLDDLVIVPTSNAE